MWRFLTLLALILLTACAQNEDAWARIRETGVLRVGLDPTYPPFEDFDGAALTGIDVDLAHELGGALNLEVEFVHFGYDGLYDALATGQVDVLLSALVILPERTQDFAYSDPYFNAGEILIVPQDSSIDEMADLNGRSLSVELGAQGHVLAAEWARQLPGLTVNPFDSPEEAITAVLQQQTDAVLIDQISGRLFLKEQPGLRRLPEPVTVEPYALVVRASDAKLLSRLNDSLDQLRASGQLDAILSRWLGP